LGSYFDPSDAGNAQIKIKTVSRRKNIPALETVLLSYICTRLQKAGSAEKL